MKQEDKMSKTKLVPFDIERAKNGAKVVTRNGLPAKIVDYPIKNEDRPILGLILVDGKEFPLIFTKTGNKYNDYSEGCYDLFIEEEVEEDGSDYDPYKATVESIADMVERYSELQTLEELKHFYNNVKVKCREAVEYDNIWNKKQDEKPANNKPKFKVGDVMRTLEEAKADITEGLPVVVSIDDDKYHCNNETIYIKDQDEYEYPPMNRLEINPDKWYTCIESWSTIDMKIGDWFEEGHYYLGSDILKYKGLLEKDEDFKDYFHPWNISDVKDGDVLVNGSNIFIFHFFNDTRFMGYCHVNTDNGKFSNDLGKNECFGLIDAEFPQHTPATKEQRELLFQKIKEAGYEWNADKKELHKMGKIKTRKMTYKELAWWLREHPEEHREYTHEDIRKSSSNVYSVYDYNTSYADEEVNEYIRIRKNGGEWQEPLIEL